MKKYLVILATLLFAVCLTQTATAALIDVDYTATFLGGDQWRYDYAVTNNSDAGIYVLNLNYDANSYGFDWVFDDPEEAVMYDSDFMAAPDGWASVALAGSIPNGLIPHTLMFYTDDAPIGLLGTLDMFSVTFSWFGSGDPGSQYFQAYDANWGFIGDGNTSIGNDTPVVPEPGTLALLGTGIIGLVAYCRRNRKR